MVYIEINGVRLHQETLLAIAEGMVGQLCIGLILILANGACFRPRDPKIYWSRIWRINTSLYALFAFLSQVFWVQFSLYSDTEKSGVGCTWTQARLAAWLGIEFSCLVCLMGALTYLQRLGVVRMVNGAVSMHSVGSMCMGMLTMYETGPCVMVLFPILAGGIGMVNVCCCVPWYTGSWSTFDDYYNNVNLTFKGGKHFDTLLSNLQVYIPKSLVNMTDAGRRRRRRSSGNSATSSLIMMAETDVEEGADMDMQHHDADDAHSSAFVDDPFADPHFSDRDDDEDEIRPADDGTQTAQSYEEEMEQLEAQVRQERQRQQKLDLTWLGWCCARRARRKLWRQQRKRKARAQGNAPIIDPSNYESEEEQHRQFALERPRTNDGSSSGSSSLTTSSDDESEGEGEGGESNHKKGVGVTNHSAQGDAQVILAQLDPDEEDEDECDVVDDLRQEIESWQDGVHQAHAPTRSNKTNRRRRRKATKRSSNPPDADGGKVRLLVPIQATANNNNNNTTATTNHTLPHDE
jgi:hypothetical protein